MDNWTPREQKLVDISFEMVLTVLDNENLDYFKKLPIEGRANWVAKQLRDCGFPTEPCGAKWGCLVETKKFQSYDAKKHGDLLTLDEFMACDFTDDDGEGYYATSSEVSNIPVDVKNVKPNDAKITHIDWYNK